MYIFVLMMLYSMGEVLRYRPKLIGYVKEYIHFHILTVLLKHNTSDEISSLDLQRG